MRFNIFLLFSLFVYTSCLELPTDTAIPADKVLSVSGLLRNNTNTQEIYLSKGCFVIDSFRYSEELSVSNAEITLLEGRNQYSFIEDDSLKGKYILNNWSPIGNFNYTITIRHDAYPYIETNTLFPDLGDFDVKYIFDKAGNLLLTWNPINNCTGYRVDLLIWKWRYTFHNKLYKEYYWAHTYWGNTTDTKTKIENFLITDRGKMTDIKVIISAEDKNYYNYLKFSNTYDPLDFHLIDYGNYSTIDNAVGFIGSSYTDSIIIKRQ